MGLRFDGITVRSFVLHIDIIAPSHLDMAQPKVHALLIILTYILVTNHDIETEAIDKLFIVLTLGVLLQSSVHYNTACIDGCISKDCP